MPLPNGMTALTETMGTIPARQTSKTYRLDLKNKRVRGFVDHYDAMVQAVQKIALTERFAWLIYSWNYGIELDRWIGVDMPRVKAGIGRCLREAFVNDDRVVSVDNIQIEQTAVDTLFVTCEVMTLNGRVEYNGAVNI